MGTALVPIIATVASTFVSSLFTSEPDVPTAAPQQLPDAPTADDAAVQKAADDQRKRAATSGMASTILYKGNSLLDDTDTDNSDKLLGG